MRKTNSVFLVDDDPDDIELMSLIMLEIYPGVLITAFNDGQKLIDYLSLPGNHLPHFLVIDYSMPLCDGPHLLAWLRQNHFEKMPAFILSTSNVERHKNECLAAGAAGYFTKPDSLDRLRFLVMEIFRQVEAL